MAEIFNKAGQIAEAISTHEEYKYAYSEEIIPFGSGVMRGTDPVDQCKLMVTGGKFIGLALHRNVNLTDDLQYPEKSTVELLQHGIVWVRVNEAVVAGDKAACGEGGKWGKSGTANYDDVNGIYETSAAKDGYAKLRLK